MKNNAPTFAFIGKPNNGKSSMISTLTFDDRIEISKTVGTTTKASEYSYGYNDVVICNFYDTPGFEKAKILWNFIRKNKNENSYGNNLLRKYIEKNQSENSIQKDIEILKAILESDFIVFIVNISEDFNQNVIGYELEIIKYIKKPVIILFNQIDENIDYSQNWTEQLKKCGLLNIHRFNPMNRSYESIQNIFKTLYTVNSTLKEKQHLDNILQVHRKQFSDNKQKSAQEIAEMIKKILHLEHKERFLKDELTSEDKQKALIAFQKKIYTIERETKKSIEHIWGYYEVQVKDNRENFDSDENIKLGLTKHRMVALGTTMGAIAGVPLDIFAWGLGALGGGIIGGVSAFVVSEKMYSTVFIKKEIIHKVSKNNFNISFILIKRSLEHLDRLIQHSHANRNIIEIPQDNEQLKFNTLWHFEKEEEKMIVNIHSAIVKDEETSTREEELVKILEKIIDREI